MGYNPKPQGFYGNRPRHTRPYRSYRGSARIHKETSWKVNLDGLKKIEDLNITPSPIEYVSENTKSGAVKAGFKLISTEVDGAIKNKIDVKFPEKQKKPKETDVV